MFFFGQFAICLQNHLKRIFKFSRASSKVLPWVLTPEFLPPRQPTKSPTCLYAAVSFMSVSSLHSGSLSSPSRRAKSFKKPLDEFVIYNLPIAFKSGNTTVLFPSAIRDSTRSPSRFRSSRTQIS